MIEFLKRTKKTDESEAEVQKQLDWGRQAAEAEAGALAKKAQLFNDAANEYAKDCVGFRFRCERIDDWLQIFVARSANPKLTDVRSSFWYYPQTQAVLVYLKNVTFVELKEGHLPDFNGELEYANEQNYTDGTYNVRPRYPYIPYGGRPIWYEDVSSQSTYFMSSSCNENKIKFKTLNYVRAAEDDIIVFNGIHSTLHTPAGKGQEVYNKILEAKRDL